MTESTPKPENETTTGLATTTEAKPQRKRASRDLPLSSGKALDGLAEKALKEFETVTAVCDSGKADQDHLLKLMSGVCKGGEILTVAHGYNWLSKGVLLTTLKKDAKRRGYPWMKYFEDVVSTKVNMKPRSEQLARKLYSDYEIAQQVNAEATQRAVQEFTQVNQLCGAMKQIAAEQDPWAEDSTDEQATDQSPEDLAAAIRLKGMKMLKGWAKKFGDAGVPSDVVAQLVDALKAIEASLVDEDKVNETNTKASNATLDTPATSLGTEPMEEKEGKES